jgi:hypothetical protein
MSLPVKPRGFRGGTFGLALRVSFQLGRVTRFKICILRPFSLAGRDGAGGQQLAFFQVPHATGEAGSVGIVRDHHHGLAELPV